MITCLEKEKIEENSIVDAKIITNDIYKIYDTVGKFAEKFEIAEKKSKNDINSENTKEVLKESIFGVDISGIKTSEEIIEETAEPIIITDDMQEEIWKEILGTSNSESTNSSFTYNEELLKYAGVIENNSKFIKMSLEIGGSLILLIAVFSIVMLYTAFKMTYSERAKELGMLSAIGMNKKQRNNIVRKETLILGILRNNYRNNYRDIYISYANKYNQYIIKELYI